MLFVLYFFIYIGVNIGIALIHRTIRAHKIMVGDTTQLNHTLWGGIYLALLVPLWFISHSWWLVAGIILQHAWIFAPAFSLLIGMPPFNLSKTTKSIYDQSLRKLGFNSTEVPTLITFLLSVALLTKAIIHA